MFHISSNNQKGSNKYATINFNLVSINIYKTCTTLHPRSSDKKQK